MNRILIRMKDGVPVGAWAMNTEVIIFVMDGGSDDMTEIGPYMFGDKYDMKIFGGPEGMPVGELGVIIDG